MSEFRSKLSFTFFKDIFDKHLSGLSRETYKGFHIYAVDGDQLDLPASKDVLENGYRGFPTSKNRETYYPKMYTAHAFDIINNVVKDFKYSTGQDETHLAQQMSLDFEKNSIAIYDRLHCGFMTFFTHLSTGNFFISRARSSQGGGGNKDVLEFANSDLNDKEFDWKPTWAFRGFFPLRLRMVKVVNPRNKEKVVFITNLPSNQFSRKEIEMLYQRRWSIEVSFRDLTQTLKMTEFHSKTVNGILQEIYSLLWFVNTLKYRILKIDPKSLRKREYTKANFKVCCEIFIENIKLLIKKKGRHLEKLIDYWASRTKEKRVRYERIYPRAVRKRGREYTLMNVVPKRLTERH